METTQVTPPLLSTQRRCNLPTSRWCSFSLNRLMGRVKMQIIMHSNTWLWIGRKTSAWPNFQAKRLLTSILDWIMTTRLWLSTWHISLVFRQVASNTTNGRKVVWWWIVCTSMKYSYASNWSKTSHSVMTLSSVLNSKFLSSPLKKMTGLGVSNWYLTDLWHSPSKLSL